MYGYQLRAEFERRTGTTWPLNVGQVYSTLSRLERDGLVQPQGDDGQGHAYYRSTEKGRAEVARWFAEPVPRNTPPRDQLAIKLALAITVPGVDVRQIVQRQRTHTLKTLQDYTRLKARTDPDRELAWLLVLDSLIFQAEAEVRWLDHCESRLARRGWSSPSDPPYEAAPPDRAKQTRGAAAATPTGQTTDWRARP